LIYGGAFIFNGFIVLFLFKNQGLSPQNETLLYGIMFIGFVFILFWLWVVNILRTAIKVKKHPEMLREDAPICRIFDLYWEKLEKEYKQHETKDIIKDLSRKALHFVVLAIIILGTEIPKRMEPTLTAWGFTPLAIRNFFYVLIAFFFLFMFTTADILRVNKMEWLPDWGLKWYGKSVEISTEKYTYISSVPMLLTLMMFIPAPFSILMVGAIVSCVSDAAASIVGKNFGKHKMDKFGHYPQKSFEGLFAGVTSAFLGTIIILRFYPLPGVTDNWAIVLGLLAALSFFYIDAFSKYVVDNVLNILLPAVLVYIVYLIAIA
jgi:dolichol kinase